MVYCNNDRCEHNGNNVKGVCDLDDTYIDVDSCVSRRKKEQEDNYKAFMQVQSSNCLRNGGKFKNKHGTVLK